VACRPPRFSNISKGALPNRQTAAKIGCNDVIANSLDSCRAEGPNRYKRSSAALRTAAASFSGDGGRLAPDELYQLKARATVQISSGVR
jgi:hypothetical protein